MLFCYILGVGQPFTVKLLSSSVSFHLCLDIDRVKISNKATQSEKAVSRNRKLEIQLRVKTDSLYLTTPKHSGGEDKLAVQVQTPEHSGGADIIGSAGAVNPAVQSLQLGQRIQSSPHPSGNTETRPGENSLRTWKTDTESKNTTRVKTI